MFFFLNNTFRHHFKQRSSAAISYQKRNYFLVTGVFENIHEFVRPKARDVMGLVPMTMRTYNNRAHMLDAQFKRCVRKRMTKAMVTTLLRA